MKRHEVLKSVEGVVAGLIQQFTPDPEVPCRKASLELSQLAQVAKSIGPGGVPVDFAAGIQSVIQQLDAFRSGYASNAPGEQVTTKAMSLSEFLDLAKGVVEKAVAAHREDRLAEALSELHRLKADIIKAESYEDATVINVTVRNDPAALVPTSADGSRDAAGTSAPSTAPTNFAANPGAITAPAPSTAPNPSTDSAQNAPVSAPAGDTNYVAKMSAITAVVAKADTAPRRITEVGWANDLATPEFMDGAKKRYNFGRDGQ